MPRILPSVSMTVGAAPLLLLLTGAASRSAAPPVTEAASHDTVTRSLFGVLPNGDSVHVYTLANTKGTEVRAIDYGGIIVSLRTRDRTGQLGDIVLGYDNLRGYLESSPYFGAIIGRYANRIARGRFTLDGKAYRLVTNNGQNHLHGGTVGFDKMRWRAQPIRSARGVGVVFTRTSPDGEEGYPGTLVARVSYTLTARDELVFEYEATTDKPTPVNLTQHSYFNLTGDPSRDILGHQLTLAASRYVPVDSTLIPTGTLAPVAGTPFDFRTLTPIGARIDEANVQLQNGRGYDHTFVFDSIGRGLTHVARVVEPRSGRTLEIATAEPGVQLYTGNFLDGTITGKRGRVYGRRSGFCLETHHFPDSPNHPAFPSTILRPGQTYRSRTVLTFGVAP